MPCVTGSPIWPPGGGDAGEPHHHVLDYAFVYVAKGRLLGARSDGAAGLDGDVSWFDIPDGAGADPAFAHGGVNGYDDLPMREQAPLWSDAALRVAEEHAARLVEQPEWVLSEVLLSPDLAPHILAQLPTKDHAAKGTAETGLRRSYSLILPTSRSNPV
ncbi:hypothetical protein EMIHUDRAFT_213008 [Emiliania huxleyi CCMP1516]|uniref:Uncharacterized protein n=2 Tax=Emiliania huxleyi TaxID=2903 RepID=A0A0D3INH8_EMIH1|nr:hypothetical protein EMIHUDRAFT_213008 [Emiliania huxleyi CCMP1516]EOD12813.1 hypothetical protein EMIHUDRAFT_213008 [Emiliania huxleyi CCMP1516]|eukprot:XP_005765242.1 hypothetical protein EMIHUDRAFT_213008 [Emiliania huxleyi CCMP1516]